MMGQSTLYIYTRTLCVYTHAQQERQRRRRRRRRQRRRQGQRIFRAAGVWEGFVANGSSDPYVTLGGARSTQYPVHNTQYTHTHTLSLSLSLSTSCPQIGAERASAPRHDVDFFDFITVSVYNQTGG